MKIIDTHYLDDGKLFNDGRPVRLIKMEGAADYDQLLDNIISSNVYTDEYLTSHLKCEKHKVKMENLPIAAMTHYLRPGSVLELGCGQGEVLFMLDQAGAAEVRGVELSPEMKGMALPEIQGKIDTGDILEVCRGYREKGLKFDTICGFDIWEHLHPDQIGDCLNAVLGISQEHALFFAILPAYGSDEVFGEMFPLEFEENREDLEANRPFSHLIAETGEPLTPVNGHLIWAPALWWENLFAAHGLVREKDLERLVHAYFDPYLMPAQRTFYLLRRDSGQARERAEGIKAGALDWLQVWRLFLTYVRAIERYCARTGRDVLDDSALKGQFDDVALRLFDHLHGGLAGLRGQADGLGHRCDELGQRCEELARRLGEMEAAMEPKALHRRLWGSMLPRWVKRPLRRFLG